MTSTYNQVSMSDTATSIISSNSNRKRLLIVNLGSDTVYIGNSSSVVDTADNANGGYPLKNLDEISLADYTGDIYGICASGETATVNVIEEVIA